MYYLETPPGITDKISWRGVILDSAEEEMEELFGVAESNNIIIFDRVGNPKGRVEDDTIIFR